MQVVAEEDVPMSFCGDAPDSILENGLENGDVSEHQEEEGLDEEGYTALK